MQHRRTLLVAAGLVALGGCGPAPYMVDEAPPPKSREQDVVVLEPLPDDGDSGFEGPFEPGQVWRGTYVCRQGETDLRLVVIDASGRRVRVIFDFSHAPSRASGAYVMTGAFDPETGELVLSPREWIRRPPGYVTVGLRGRLDDDGARLVGEITHEACGGFQVRLEDEKS